MIITASCDYPINGIDRKFVLLAVKPNMTDNEKQLIYQTWSAALKDLKFIIRLALLS